MNKFYIKSDNILVFPSTRRSDKQASARYQQETTFTNDIVRLANYNNGSFIITEPQEDIEKGLLFYNTTEPFEFVIHGYWFKLAHLSDLLTLVETNDPNATKISAYIELDKYALNSTTDPKAIQYKYELIGRDDTSNENDFYTGLKIFTGDPPTQTDTRYIIPLFARDNTGIAWNISVYQKSLYRFSSNSFELEVDGGIIK